MSPFNYLELHKNGVYCCCPSWLPTKLGELNGIEKIVNGDKLKEIQESIINGTYSFCDKNLCPYLSELIHNQVAVGNFVKKTDKLIQKLLTTEQTIRVNFAFDRSCNLSCPSCRVSVIMANGKEIELIDQTIEKITNELGYKIDCIYLSGSADPFASKSFRKFLLNFDKSKFPKLNLIHIHTNAILLNEELWNRLEHLHKYIRTIDVSIDAASRDTYEVVRRGGDWDILLKNIEFISNIKTIGTKTFSFVVQDNNYMEMYDFYKLISNLKHKTDYVVLFTKILNWGTFSDAEFKLKCIWDESHPEFNKFLHQLDKINSLYKCSHNMNDIIKRHLPKKINSLI